MARLPRLGLALVATVLLAGCASTVARAPDWKPKPSFSGEGPGGGNPQPAGPDQPTPTAPGSSGPSSPSPSQTTGPDPNVVATKLTAPTAIAIMPDNTALVGERTTGRIVRVQPVAGKPVQTVRTISGLSTVGGGGLLDLALSPDYSQDNLIFAYVTTPTDNRVVDFTLSGPVTPVLTGIPRGATDNAGRIAFGPDGNLYVGTGDAGVPTAAANPASLAGKVLRVNDIGAAAPGNPTRGSRVLTSGHRVVAGLCIDPKSGLVFETEARTTADPVNQLTGGKSYGWPTASATSAKPLTTLPAADRAPGGCAVLDGTLYVTSLNGQSMLASVVTSQAGAVTLGKFSPSLTRKYGRLLTIVPAADGALWLTTANKDGHGKPIPDDDRVLRIVPSGGGGAGSAV